MKLQMTKNLFVMNVMKINMKDRYILDKDPYTGEHRILDIVSEEEKIIKVIKTFRYGASARKHYYKLKRK